MSFASHVLAHRSLRRRHKVGLFVLLLGLLWATGWGGAAYQINAQVDGWIEKARASGAQIQFTDRSTTGTPWDVHIHLKDFAFSVPPKTSSVQAQEAVLYIKLWDWGHFSTKLRGGITGRLGATPFKADVLKINFQKPELEPYSYRDPGFTLQVQGMGVSLQSAPPLPLGEQMEALAFTLRVMGTPPDFTQKESVQAWNEASGVIEFDQFDLRWGPLSLSVKGTLGFDPQLQPEGAFSGTVQGLEETVRRLVQADMMTEKQEKMLQSSVSVLARPSGVSGSSPPILPISIQAGSLYLGPVKVWDLPPVVF